MLRDLSHVDYDDHTPDEWKAVIDALDSGETVQVHESVWWYFLEVLPPRFMGRGGFVFAEGLEHPRWFWKLGGQHFARTVYGGKRADVWAGWREMSQALGLRVVPNL